MAGTKPVRQLSNAAETIPPGTSDAPGEGTGKIEGPPILTGPSSIHTPDVRGMPPRGDNGRQGDVVTPTPRTQSESSAPSQSILSTAQPQGLGEMPSKSQTTPVSVSGGTVEVEDKQGSMMSSRTKPQNVTSKVHSPQTSSEASKIAGGQEQRLNMVPIPEGGQLMDDTSASSSQTSSLLVLTTSHPITGTALEASSTSLIQDPSPPVAAIDKPPFASAGDRQGNGQKKMTRGKQKQLKLKFQELTSDNVVKCTLNTSTGQQVDFRFSMKYDKPGTIFKKLVSVLVGVQRQSTVVGGGEAL